jgi:hypothetical protein
MTMRMNAKPIGWIALGLVGGWLAFGGGGRALAEAVTGIWASHSVKEIYHISIGIDAADKPRKEERAEEIRQHWNLPQHYGNLIGVTGQGDAAVFWYQDAGGVIRNAIVPSANTQLHRISYTMTSRYEEDILP